MAVRMRGSDLIEQSDRWLLPIVGGEVAQCRFDYALTLVIDRDGSFEVRIEQPFTFEPPNGEECSLDPASDPGRAGRALELLHDRVTGAAALKDGRLELKFESGAAIRVPGGGELEPWNVVGPGGLRFVSVPDGGLTIWSGGDGEAEGS